MVVTRMYWQAGRDREEPVQVPDVQEEVQARREAAHRVLHRAGWLVLVVGVEPLGFVIRNNTARRVNLISERSRTVIKAILGSGNSSFFFVLFFFLQ